MSLRTANTTNLVIPGLRNNRSLSGQSITQPVVQPYSRPADWVTIGTSTATQYAQLLVAVYNNTSNFVALSAAGAYTVDWGDGTSAENFATGVQANHTYSYSAVGNLSSRGYRQAVITVTPQSGQNITQFSIQRRHTSVINSSVNYSTPILDMTLKVPNLTSQLSLGIGASALTVNIGLLEQVTILSHGITGSFQNIFFNCYALQSVPLFNTAAATSMASMFENCKSLQTVPLFNTASVTNMSRMFFGCNKLITVPLFDTGSVGTVGMTNMFNNCFALQSVPLFNTSKVTGMAGMFSGCNSLQSVPLFDTRLVTSMNNMFLSCFLLQSIPLFDTRAVTDMTSFVRNCSALVSFPLLNTASVTLMPNMFDACSSLQSVALFNMSLVTNATSMFQNCKALTTVPAFDTRSVQNMTSMFSGCDSLTTLPVFNTTAATNQNATFANCVSLQTITLSTTTAVTNMNSMFSGATNLKQVLGPFTATNVTVGNFANIFTSCVSLVRCQITGTNQTISFLNCNLGGTEIDEIFSGLSASGAGKTITMTGNWGTSTATRSIATTKGWTVVL